MKTPEEIGQDIVYPENKTLDALWESICSIYPWVGERLEEIRFRAISAIRAERTHPAPDVREALEAAYVENQNMHCFETKGKLKEALNAQTKILRATLSLPGLEAVNCQTCYGNPEKFVPGGSPCPQRCDKGRVWVRKAGV